MTENTSEPSAEVDKDDEESVKNIRFSPPVFRQRYSAALDVAKKSKVKSVADFGCAECKMLIMYKNILNLERLVGVDIDQELLRLHGYRAKPLMHEFIVKPRNIQLHAQVFCGSIADLDDRLRDVDMVSAIELIEHLYPDVLEKVPKTIFGFIRPKVALITTPNGEFNKYFGFSPGQFRLWDHKFEWSREQFKQWCDNCCNKYGYDVEISQIGFLGFQSKEDREQVTGGCSQMALFTLKHEQMEEEERIKSDGQLYETIVDVLYPFDERSQTQRIIHEMSYVISRLTRESELLAELVYEPQKAVMPLEKFLEFPILKQQIEGDVQMLEDVFKLRATAEFAGIELVCDESGCKSFVKWIHPYDNSPSETEEDFNQWSSEQVAENTDTNQCSTVDVCSNNVRQVDEADVKIELGS